MQTAPNASLRKRLMLRFVASAGISLLLASGALFAAELTQARHTMVRNLSALTRVVGTNCAAPLLFQDAESATEVLSALAAQPAIEVAALYDAEGRIFARFTSAGFEDARLPAAVLDGHAFASGRLELFEPIELHGERLGTAFVRSGTRELVEMAELYGGIVIGVTIGALLLSYLGARSLRDDIARPLDALVDGSARMAAGDLSVQVDVQRDDELGTLARAFNSMASSLRELVAQVGRNTRSVTSVNESLQAAGLAIQREAARQATALDDTTASFERIAASTESVNASVEALSTTALETASAQTQMDASISLTAGHMDELTATIDGTASTVEQMTSGIRETAQSVDSLNASADSTAEALTLLSSAVKQVEANARETHTLSEETFRQAEEGGRSVEQTVRGMEDIQVSFQGLETIVSDLTKKSESIGEIVEVIEGVVDQTTLLALNAAIISAQAGEHGRSFAVVAEEVGSLAERTAGSTREIRALIEGVQGSVTNAVAAMRNGRTRVDQGVDLASRAGGLLKTIGEGAHESTARVREIVESSESQARDIERVDAAMLQLGEIANQLSRATGEQNSARADILRAVEQMRQLGQQVQRSTEEQRNESRLISESAKTVADRIEHILDATRDQSRQGQQIKTALQVFRRSTDESHQRREEMQSDLSDLAARAQELEQEIDRFQL